MPFALGVRRSFRCSLALTALLVALAPTADAVGARSFHLDSLEGFSGGDLRGVAVDSQGHVRAGWSLAALTIPDANSIWSAVDVGGATLLGTGPTGKLLRFAGGRLTPYADTKQLAVTSLAVGQGGAVFAATLPAGKIFRIDAGGKTTELPHIVDADNIWSLAFDAKKNAFYAATGPHGKLFRVQPTGGGQLVFDSDETNLVSVAVGDDGAVYAGSSGKALIFKIAGPGRASVVFDCPGDEVKALAPAKGGALYAICNDFGGEIPDPPHRSANAAVTPAGPSSQPRGKAGKGALYRIEADGRAERLLANNESHYVSLALDEAGRPYVGTGVEGRVYTVDENHTTTLIADTDERQVGAMLLTGRAKLIATSDPAVIHEITGAGGPDATWTSRVLDAGLHAQLGELFWRADGALEFQTRTGNAALPDTTWSDWSATLTAPSKTSSPPGRYVQIRARFARDPRAVLRDVRLSFVTDNMRAVVTSVDALAKGADKGEKGEKGSTKELPSSGGEVPPRSPMLHVTWHVENPDNDVLRYRVQFRLDSQTGYRDITKPDEIVSKTELDWDTSSLPEGTYRVKVEASDETSNPPERVTRHAIESGTIVVDNTPPVFRALAAKGRRIEADIVDGVSAIARVDFAVDGRTEWRPLGAKDGVFDETNEKVDTDLNAVLTPGPHLIAVRAFDQAGNFVVRDVEMK